MHLFWECFRKRKRRSSISLRCSNYGDCFVASLSRNDGSGCFLRELFVFFAVDPSW